MEAQYRQGQLHHAEVTGDVPPEERDVVQLITLRSNGQFNTTVYNYDDRLRGI
jgi:hypothetical protein